jgi:hypothetical protein
LGLFGRKKSEGGETAKILKKKYRARHAFDKFKMNEACNVIEECCASLIKQDIETRVLDEYVVDVDVDTANNVVTITYDEGREFFRKDEEGNWGRIEPGG